MRRVPPRFSIPPADSEIMPGGNVNITCVAVGSPMPYVKWMLGAEDLTPEDDMPIGRNVLELTDVRQSNNYTCVAMSTLGVIEAVAQIIVKGECHREAVDSFLTVEFTEEALCDWLSNFIFFFLFKSTISLLFEEVHKENLGLIFFPCS